MKDFTSELWVPLTREIAHHGLRCMYNNQSYCIDFVLKRKNAVRIRKTNTPGGMVTIPMDEIKVINPYCKDLQQHGYVWKQAILHQSVIGKIVRIRESYTPMGSVVKVDTMKRTILTSRNQTFKPNEIDVLELLEDTRDIYKFNVTLNRNAMERLARIQCSLKEDRHKSISEALLEFETMLITGQSF